MQLHCVCLTRVTTVLCHAGSTEELWKDIWDKWGSCTGMTVAEYFTFIAVAFNTYDANVSTERVIGRHCCSARPTFLHACLDVLHNHEYIPLMLAFHHTELMAAPSLAARAAACA